MHELNQNTVKIYVSWQFYTWDTDGKNTFFIIIIIHSIICIPRPNMTASWHAHFTSIIIHTPKAQWWEIPWAEQSSPLTLIYSQQFITYANEWGEVAALRATPRYRTAVLQEILSSATLPNRLTHILGHRQSSFLLDCFAYVIPNLCLFFLLEMVHMLSIFQIICTGNGFKG